MRRLAAVALLAAAALTAGCLTPLHHAAENGDVNEIRRLIAAGANPNAVNEGVDRWTPMSSAIFANQPEAVQALLDGGADPAFRTAQGTPYQMAMAQGHLEIARILKAAEDRKYGRVPRSSAVDAGAAPAPPPPSVPARAVRESDVDRAPASSPERPDDFALVVGIEKYSRLPEARFAERDADAVKTHLLALGYPERNIILLKGGQATRGALQGYLEEWLPRNVKPDSRVFVYFSGHGSPDPKSGDAYLVPWDGDAMFLKSTAYPLKTLYATLGRLPAKHVVVALDSCFSGAGGRSVLASGARPLVSHVDETSAPAGVTVLSAASGDEITATLDDQGHGAFTYYLLKSLNDGRRTARAAYAELKPRVQDEAHRQNREQTPLLLGDDATF
ncbi:MAG: caspase family protein [Elusimicrobia bacterium]|nr:caspase family protein [Elusimicrobiota bacterium]